ncbi:MAG: deoxyribodipyrimidine photolyase [Deltaproteobacteria bacterium]|nr:MAG: deoxyribodipyrimidine photolyase [Deltaproteobacteria bacterium]
MTPAIATLRVYSTGDLREDGDYVVYWMIAARRTHYSHALQHAAHLCEALGKPLVVLEAIRADSRWASERVHRYVIQGMADNAARFADKGVAYHPYVEPSHGDGTGLLEALAERACLVVTDTFPSHFLPRMVAAVRERLDVRLDEVDGNGVIPLRAPDRDFTVAHSFRRWLQKNVAELWDPPVADPLTRATAGATIPGAVRERWPAFADGSPTGDEPLPAPLAASLAGTPGPIPERGGPAAAREAWRTFWEGKFERYHEDRSHPDDGVQSGLSGWLHFGHLGVHEVLADVLADWDPATARKATGKREGWWGLPEASEAFLDEILTWREIGYIQAFREGENFAHYQSLPAWARESLAEHAGDPREVYTLEQLAESRTDDVLWNAAQRELVRTGRIHNALRMLWGKKVLQWTASPQQAFAFLVELNNRYAIDGRNPNSYSGIGWVLGRFDRAWGPERPIFGKVRYMTSDSARRKWRVKQYLSRFG